MHVYHYAPYEPAAFRRLMGRYASREAEIDRMLRAELFVDLHAVVKHSLRASPRIQGALVGILPVARPGRVGIDR
jgi:predicted RecB family nuclease